MKQGWKSISALTVACALALVPTPVQAEGDIGKVGQELTLSASSSRSYVINKDGSLWAWGDVGDRLFDGTGVNLWYSLVKIMDDVASVSAGSSHTLAVKTDGSLWGWGWNYYGQLGDGSQEIHYSPVKITDDVAAVSTAMSHTLVMKTDVFHAYEDIILLVCGFYGIALLRKEIKHSKGI